MEQDVMPCYVVCDVSLSMTDHVDELNAGLREFRGALRADSAVAGRVRCWVLGFAGTARVLQPLHPVAELGELPEPEPSAGTNFGPAFTLLRDVIAQDVLRLGAGRHRVRRPVVFFLSDGLPTDPVTWPAAYAALTDPSWSACPAVFAFGLGDADAGTLSRIGTARTYLGRDGVRMGAALIASVTSALAGDAP